MSAEHTLQFGHSAVRRTGGCNGLRLTPRIAGDVLRQFQHDAGGVLAQLGRVGREPAVDGVVHEQVAEKEHEDGGGQGDQHRAQHHAGAQPRAQGTAALVRIKLEDVSEQEEQQHQQGQKHHYGKAGKGQRFSGGLWIQKADAGEVEGLQCAQEGEKEHHAGSHKNHRAPPRIGQNRHAAIIERVVKRRPRFKGGAAGPPRIRDRLTL